MEQRTVELFDLPYQWVFPLVFITMTLVIGYCFMKYVIFTNDKDEDEDEVAEKVEPEVVEQSEEPAPVAQRESSDEKASK